MEHNETLLVLKWALGVLTPVVGALCSAVVVLYKRLKEMTREMIQNERECSEEKEKIREAWMKDIRKMNEKHVEMLSTLSGLFEEGT